MSDRSMGSIGVFVKKGESIDKATRRFKKKIDSSKILKEYKDRQEYIKPSVAKRLKKSKSIMKQKLLQQYESDM